MGPRPLGSWSLLCSRPAPPLPARGGGGWGAEASPGRPGAGGPRAPARSPSFFRLPLPCWSAGPGGAHNWSCLALHGPERLFPPAPPSSPASAGPGALCTPWAWRGSSSGPVAGAVFFFFFFCALHAAPFAAEPQFSLSVKWGKVSSKGVRGFREGKLIRERSI